MVESTSGCTSEHSIAHALGAYHPNLPHGAALIMISREYYALFARRGFCDARITDMARALGHSGANQPADFVTALVGLQKACGVDGLKMSEYGILREELPKYAKNARETMGGLFAGDRMEVTDSDTLSILEKSYC